jgi:hypothetical protein
MLRFGCIHFNKYWLMNQAGTMLNSKYKIAKVPFIMVD